MTGLFVRYKILLFDVDDTLLDFGANELVSLNRLFSEQGYMLSDELMRTYNSVNKQLWMDYENGAVSLEDVLHTRFSKTMLLLGEQVDGVAWEMRYRELLGNGHQLIDGALEVCQGLAASHRLFVVTNGVRKTQLKRLRLAGLYHFFEDIFDSQSVGYQKPSKGFFDHVKAHITDFQDSETLIIGDSLATDIKGGNMAGIDTCWFNRAGLKCADDSLSTYTISSLPQLFNICCL